MQPHPHYTHTTHKPPHPHPPLQVLVDILKQDWPHKWPSFIPDIVGASRTNETLCENSMAILRLLSEEVFDFSKDSLTAVRCPALRCCVC